MQILNDNETAEDLTLPPLGGDKDSITVMGWSSGAFMAFQLGVVYSSMIKGLGLHEGGPFGDGLRIAAPIPFALKDELFGDIDPLKNIKNMPVMISSGSSDSMVPRILQQDVRLFYDFFGANLDFHKTTYEHVWPVDKPVDDFWQVRSCENKLDGSPYYGKENCQDDMAGRFIKYMYENIYPETKINDRTDKWPDLGVLRKYDQHELVVDDVVEDGFTDFGYVYYPFTCL